MATTTMPLIRAEIETKIRAITPASLSDKKFDRCPQRYRLRPWATEAAPGGACLRKFELTSGSSGENQFQDPSVIERQEMVIVTVAYPNLPSLYGTSELDDMRDIIRRDARDIRDTVFKSSNYVSGQNAAMPQDLEPVDAGESVWFQDLKFLVLFNEAQTL